MHDENCGSKLLSVLDAIRCLPQVKVQSHDIVLEVKKRMLEALHAREDISSRVRSYHLEGRTKGLVSTFRKVGIAGI